MPPLPLSELLRAMGVRVENAEGPGTGYGPNGPQACGWGVQAVEGGPLGGPGSLASEQMLGSRSWCCSGGR